LRGQVERGEIRAAEDDVAVAAKGKEKLDNQIINYLHVCPLN